MKNFSATLIPALSGSQLNNSTTGLTTDQRQIINRVNGLKTGQTTSYRTGDDGDFEYGRNHTFTTLTSNNPFGNSNRFTDQSGGQTYSDNIVVDWATGLMWFKTVTGSSTWNQAIDNSLAATDGGYTDWFLPNIMQIIGICNMSLSSPTSYAPFSHTISTSADRLWVSTTNAGGTNAYTVISGAFVSAGEAKTLTRSYIYCRQFTYNNGTFS
jgi:hypothetical protein